MRQFDYSALEQPVSFSDAWKEFRKDNTAILSYGLRAIILVAPFGISLAYGRYDVSLFILVLFALVCAVVAFNFKQQVLLKRFVVTNQLKYVDNTYPIEQPGIIFNTGDERTFAGGIADDNEGWFLANYGYTTGSGKSKKSHEFGVMRVKLLRRLPHVLLDSKKNNFYSQRLPSNFSSDQNMQLEGDFNNHFKLYAPANYQQDVLYFLTPELMIRLVDRGANYDFEIIDDNLFIYGEKIDFRKSLFQKHIELWMELAGYFSKEFNDNIARYADSRVENSKQLNIVGADGARLKRRIAWTSVILTAILVAVYILPWAVQLFT